ncbi:hypothetical protein Ndes2437B_g01124 [Nannochloris sp. 'desiccata']|nr:hypothetical protein KSW81_006235 [Chlorella desiccata (nom. nud.)]
MTREEPPVFEDLQNANAPSLEASYESPMGTLTRSRPSPLIETPPPPGKDSNSLAPAGMDAASYAAGERAAYARAFSAALPSQQALGQLFQAVDTLHERLEVDAAAVRSLQDESIRTSETMASMSHRLEYIEGIGLPGLQRRCDDIAARPALSPEVASALLHLRTTLSDLSLSQQRCLETAVGYAGRNGYFVQQLQTLLQTLSTYAGGVLSKADVAAIFLSRKVLIGDVAEVVGGVNRINSKLRVSAGAALFVGLVECAWQVQERTAQQLPRVLRSANAPLRTGLKAARTVVWTAAFILAVNEVRTACGEFFSGHQPSATSTAPNNSDIKTGSSTLSATSSPQQAPYSPSLAGTLGDLESGRSPARRPASAGSPAPAKELLRDNDLFEKPIAEMDSADL